MCVCVCAHACVHVRACMRVRVRVRVYVCESRLVSCCPAAENQVEIMESVRGKDVFIIQTGSCRWSDDDAHGEK